MHSATVGSDADVAAARSQAQLSVSFGAEEGSRLQPAGAQHSGGSGGGGGGRRIGAIVGANRPRRLSKGFGTGAREGESERKGRHGGGKRGMQGEGSREGEG